MTPEQLAQLFHETYERLAPEFGYTTRKSSAQPWANVPEPNKSLMIAVAKRILEQLNTQDRELREALEAAPDPRPHFSSRYTAWYEHTRNPALHTTPSEGGSQILRGGYQWGEQGTPSEEQDAPDTDER
jgi:hypothetical protein